MEAPLPIVLNTLNVINLRSCHQNLIKLASKCMGFQFFHFRYSLHQPCISLLGEPVYLKERNKPLVWLSFFIGIHSSRKEVDLLLKWRSKFIDPDNAPFFNHIDIFLFLCRKMLWELTEALLMSTHNCTHDMFCREIRKMFICIHLLFKFFPLIVQIKICKAQLFKASLA